jgi:uncharacterized circularly permuted ATP-grasp superfamily protein
LSATGAAKESRWACGVRRDERLRERGGPEAVRAAYDGLRRWLDTTPPEVFDTRRSQAELFFRRIGITFAVYGDNESPNA